MFGGTISIPSLAEDWKELRVHTARTGDSKSLVLVWLLETP